MKKSRFEKALLMKPVGDKLHLGWHGTSCVHIGADFGGRGRQCPVAASALRLLLLFLLLLSSPAVSVAQTILVTMMTSFRSIILMEWQCSGARTALNSFFFQNLSKVYIGSFLVRNMPV